MTTVDTYVEAHGPIRIRQVVHTAAPADTRLLMVAVGATAVLALAANGATVAIVGLAGVALAAVVHLSRPMSAADQPEVLAPPVRRPGAKEYASVKKLTGQTRAIAVR